MDKLNFNIGDKVIHKSDSSVIWIIERFDGDEVYCSTLLKDTKKQNKEKFALTSIEKYNPPPVPPSIQSIPW